MDETLAIILQNTFSQTQLKHRLRILKSHLLETFFGTQNKATLQINPEDLTWLKSLPASFYQKFSKDNVYEVFSYLDQSISKLVTLTMYLSFEPNNETVNQIGLFARETFNLPTLLLDIKFNPNLIAGTALSWKGVYKDYSVKARIEERKNEIFQEFKKFLR